MQYFISFLEGIITFISPCLLPMIPIYISYLMGSNEKSDKSRLVKNSLGFVLGFTLVFVSLGAFAGTLGSFLTQHQRLVNLITGAIVIIFGLNFAGFIKIGFLNKSSAKKSFKLKSNFPSSVLFGIIFSVGWTPCVGAFLGSALLLASQQGSVLKGIIMLVAYSFGLGIPFILSAILIEKLKSTFEFIKRHYTAINRVCGIILIVVGIFMMTGAFGNLLSMFSF